GDIGRETAWPTLQCCIGIRHPSPGGHWNCMRQPLLRLRAAIYKLIPSDYESLTVLLSSVTCPHFHNGFHYACHFFTSAQAAAYVCLVPERPPMRRFGEECQFKFQ